MIIIHESEKEITKCIVEVNSHKSELDDEIIKIIKKNIKKLKLSEYDDAIINGEETSIPMGNGTFFFIEGDETKIVELYNSLYNSYGKNTTFYDENGDKIGQILKKKSR